MEKKRVNLTVDGKKVQVEEGKLLIDVLEELGIYVPSLCHIQGVGGTGSCGLCIVEVKGLGLVKACETMAEEGMVIETNSEKIRSERIEALKVLLSVTKHPIICLSCPYRSECEDPLNCKLGLKIKFGCKVCAKDGACKIQEVVEFLSPIPWDEFPEIEPRGLPVIHEPFFVRDYNYCVLCGRCIISCKDVRKEGAAFVYLELEDQETGKKVVPSLKEGNCKFCGECLDACPTGALRVPWEEIPDKEVKTICPYCGTGCGVKVGIKNGRIVSIKGDQDSPVNEGELCVKGRFGISFVESEERLKEPLIKVGDSFKPTTWDEAISEIAEKLSRYGPDEVGVLSSAKCTNEENYVIQKFARVVLGTNNIDHCARLCHSSTASGLSMSIGGSAMTNSIEDVLKSKTIVVIGSNTTENHPIIGLKIKRAKEMGKNLIVINPMEIELAKIADIWIRLKPGTDVALLLAMCKVICDEGLADEEFAEKCNNFHEFKSYLKSLSLEKLCSIAGVPEDAVRKASIIYATEKPSSIFFAMGITQHIGGTNNVLAISNLALLTGNIGKEGSGINPLRGQNNVQGACDMGALPDLLPGYIKTNSELKQDIEKVWGTEIPSEPGLTVVEMFEKALSGKIKAMYIIGENPAVSDPDTSKVEKALRNLDFLVVQDIFMSQTASFAKLVLPAASFAEKHGTFTNTERRVQMIRPFKDPPGFSKPDWEIVCDIAKKMGFGWAFPFKDPEEIFSEIRRAVPSYRGITYERLENGGIQWPCPSEDHPGTPFLFASGFSQGKPSFHNVPPESGDESQDGDYPFILTTGRSLFHFHTSTMTSKVEGIQEFSDASTLEMNQEDARSLGIKDGDAVMVESRRGSIETKVSLSKRVPKGVVFLTFHFPDVRVNRLSSSSRLDPISRIPNLKVIAVRIKPKRR